MSDQDPTQPLEALPPPPGPAAAGAAVPVAPVAGRARGRNPLRWLVALVVLALVVGTGLGATLLLTSSAGATSTVLMYAPADTLSYVEARLDLPGGQRAEVAKTLAAFPGFADQASFESKMGELLDRVVRSATEGKHDYQTEIAPWFGGQLAIASGPQDLGGLLGAGASPAPSPTADPTASLPACSGGAPASPAPSGPGGFSPRALLLADLRDATRAEAWVRSALGEHGAAASDLTCDGVTVHMAGTVGAGSAGMGWAILGDRAVLAAGDLASLRLAIATRGTGGLGSTADFQRAAGALEGDRLGLVYTRPRASLAAELSQLAAHDTDGTGTAAVGVLADLVPEWSAGALRAADGNLVLDTVAPASDLVPASNRASALAGMAPADTIALFDAHDLGKTLTALRSRLAAEPKLAPLVKQLDSAVGLLGGFDGAVGWIGDAGLAVTRDGTRLSGGLLIRPEDAGAAGHLFTQIRSLADLSGAGSGVKVTDEAYKGVTVTTVDLSAMLPAIEAGVGSSLGAGSVPSSLALVFAVSDKAVVLAIDPSFVKAVIDASQGGPSLAASPRFSALLASAGSDVTGLAWLDLAATRDLIEGMLPADARARYESDIRPYVLPLDALIGVGVSDSGLLRGTLVLSVKH